MAALGCGGPKLEPLPPGAVILAFGDSLTRGTGAAPGQGYPAALERLTGLRVINSGNPGELSGEGLARLPGLLALHQPELVVLCHGGNDMLRRLSSEDLEANLRRMVELARQSGAQVMLVGVPSPGIRLRTADAYYNVAKDLEVPLEDRLLSQIMRRPSLKADQVHPNGEGYRVMAEEIFLFLQKRGAL